MYVVLVGSSTEFKIYGPFEDLYYVNRWASVNFGNCTYKIVKLEKTLSSGHKLS